MGGNLPVKTDMRSTLVSLTASIVCIVLFQISAFVHERRERDDGSGFASEYARAH